MIREEKVPQRSDVNIETEPEMLKYWRSPDQRQITPEYIKSLQDEYSFAAPDQAIGVDRRDMLKLMGASLALAGVGTACRRPDIKIMPYTKQPEYVIPGLPNYFATAMPAINDSIGIVVESHEGRPTKIEGNPGHSSSLGAANFQAQASVLQLYDPDRSRAPRKLINEERKTLDWAEWDGFVTDKLSTESGQKGEGLSFLLGSPNSPTVERLIAQLKTKLPLAQWYFYDPLHADSPSVASQSVFGRDLAVLAHLDKAKVLLSVQADPLISGPMSLRLAREFAAGRKIYTPDQAKGMNRLYVAESNFSVTGTNADHRVGLASMDTEAFVNALAYELFVTQKLAWPASFGSDLRTQFKSWTSGSKKYAKFLAVVAKDLIQNKGSALVLVGPEQSPVAHALVHLINMALEGLGKTFSLRNSAYTPFSSFSGVSGLAALVEKMNSGTIKTLIIADANPVYASPGDLDFARALAKVNDRIHIGLYEDETAQKCNWHLPLSHFLESWGDTCSYDGTLSIIQPLIAPLHNTRSLVEIFGAMVTDSPVSGYDLVQSSWRGEKGLLAKQLDWEKAIHDGFFAMSGTQEFTPTALKGQAFLDLTKSVPSLGDKVELVFRGDYRVGDGSLANLGWLQELPDPVTKLTWGNALLIGPDLAKKIGIKSGIKKRIYEAEVVRLKIGEHIVEVPSFVVPGIPDNSVTLNFGYGRTSAGYVGDGIGIDVYKIWPKNGARFVALDKIEATGRFEHLASTQEQFAMNGDVVQETEILSLQNRDPAKVATAAHFEKNPHYAQAKALPDEMTTRWQYNDNKWGMVIDLTSCIGCNACITACQSENNVPVIGAEQVMRGRTMHWLRVDRYFSGPPQTPETIVQPVPCQQCENAPCEPVCPVAATVHDTEGLNAMTYNRCVGTRYCANNCPYKVRRFNYFDYSHSGNMYVNAVDKKRQKLTEMGKNPDVTIRYRGVMEKCSYCTQRIQQAKMVAIRNKKDPNRLADNAVIPACAQTCPTDAITFGNLNAPDSRVAKLKEGGRNYVMLEELNTRPRTSYLSKLRNPNPELV